MHRIVIRPRIQVPILMLLFAGWLLIGVTHFIPEDGVVSRDWLNIVPGCVLILTGLAGMWRALRLGIVLDSDGVRIRSFDGRDRVIPWHRVRSIDCEQVDERAGLPLFAPVIRCHDGDEVFAVRVLGSYSRLDAERKVEELREMKAGDGS